MGASHAQAYHTLEGVEICGLVSPGKSKEVLNAKLGGGYALYDNYNEALQATKPDAVCISTYPDTHESYAIQALESGCHVFIEKPLADTVAGAERVAEAARKAKKKLVVGYILRHHPSWERFVQLAHELGKPLVMRMNLNQQSHGNMWTVHRNLMASLSPIVDCGVHYIDVMCQMTRSKPVQVSAIGARLTEEIPAGNYNYGQLQIRFEDGSVGWYEAGWGPMMSETAFFVKDVIGPKGCVSIVAKEAGGIGLAAGLVVNIFVAAICAAFGVLGNRRQAWALWVGMVLYTFDGLLLLLFQDWLSVAFHAYALFRIYQGLGAIKELGTLEPRPAPAVISSSSPMG